MSEPTWTERVEAVAFRSDPRGARDVVPVEFAEEMAESADRMRVAILLYVEWTLAHQPMVVMLRDAIGGEG